MTLRYDASWSILTHHDESEFELKNKMQFVAQHTIHIVFYYVCVQKFFLFQLCFWRNENKEINLISSALIKTCDYGAKVLMYVLNCCFARVTNNLVVRFNSTNKNKNNWQKTVLINAPLLANLSKRKLIISQRHAMSTRKKTHKVQVFWEGIKHFL